MKLTIKKEMLDALMSSVKFDVIEEDLVKLINERNGQNISFVKHCNVGEYIYDCWVWEGRRGVENFKFSLVATNNDNITGSDQFDYLIEKFGNYVYDLDGRKEYLWRHECNEHVSSIPA